MNLIMLSLTNCEPDHVVPDELHLLLRICYKLLTNLIDDAKSADDKNEVLGEKSNNLNKCNKQNYRTPNNLTKGKSKLIII